MRRLVIVCMLLSVPAWADDGDTSFSHKRQVGLSLRSGIGVSATVPYKSTVFCGATDTTQSGNAAVCTERAPIALTAELSYGVATSAELTLAFQFGLEHDFGAAPGMQGPIPVRLVPGARFYFSDSTRGKLFVQPQIVLDFSNYKDVSGTSRGTDVALGAVEGYMFDFNRHVGAYLFLGETIGFVRWLSGDFELGLGIQARYP
jgi:hypothetical protein